MHFTPDQAAVIADALAFAADQIVTRPSLDAAKLQRYQELLKLAEERQQKGRGLQTEQDDLGLILTAVDLHTTAMVVAPPVARKLVDQLIYLIAWQEKAVE